MSGTTAKKKICFLTHWAKNLGGAEHSLVDLVKKTREVADVQLVFSEPGALVHLFESEGISCLVIPCDSALKNIRRGHFITSLCLHLPTVISYLRFVVKVFNYLSRLQPDLVHANVPKSHMTLLLCKVLGFKAPAVLHVREIFTKRSPVFALYQMLVSVSKDVGVISISKAVEDALPGNLMQLSTVCYNGVFVPQDVSAPAEMVPLRFIYLGRIVPWKGCALLIESFAALEKKCGSQGATLSLVGGTYYWDPSYRVELASMIERYSLTDRVRLLDAVENPYEILQQHHVLCLPSCREPFGRVAAEAHACGLPVIASNSGGLPEIVEDGCTGILFPENDGYALTGAMQKMIDEPGMVVRMGRKGRVRVEKMFNVNRQVPDTVNLLMSRIS